MITNGYQYPKAILLEIVIHIAHFQNRQTEDDI